MMQIYQWFQKLKPTRFISIYHSFFGLVEDVHDGTPGWRSRQILDTVGTTCVMENILNICIGYFYALSIYN